MISIGPTWSLGELAPLAEAGLRIRAAYGPDPKIAMLSAPTLSAGSPGEHLQQLRGDPRVPVLTGDDSSLPWAVAAVSMLLGCDVAELIPDRFTAAGYLDHAAWSSLCERARDVLAASREFAHRPARIPDEVADPGLIALKQFMIDTAGAGALPVVLLDGPVPAAAALLADAAQPGSTSHLVALQPGTSRLEAMVHERLGIETLLPWHTACQDGSLAPLAIQITNFTATHSQRLAGNSTTA